MDQARIRIKRALVSVSDKAGVVELCQVLHALGVEILSTGGTASRLRDAGVSVREVSEYTGFPEMMDGRVKTLHPSIHGGLLALRGNAEHQRRAAEHGIGMIDLVVVNLYPFERTVAQASVTREEAIEQIDIGGPSMLRSGAKNHAAVAVLCAPDQYAAVIEELRANEGSLGLSTRRRLAAAAFAATAAYDTAIAEWLAAQEPDMPEYPSRLLKRLELVQRLRYGENPHQSAALYADPTWVGTSLATAKQLSGKELSYNNILDLDSALRLVMEFSRPVAAVIKHNTPCGCAEGSNAAEAFARAYDCDPMSAFGGIVAINAPVDEATALALIEGDKFLEAIVAPSFSQEALKLIVEDNPKKWGKSIRLIEAGGAMAATGGEAPARNFSDTRRFHEHVKAYEAGGQSGRCYEHEYRTVSGGLLVQSRDALLMNDEVVRCATRRKPDDDELAELYFAWAIVKQVKSNAICLSKKRQLLGVGAGHTSRVDAVEQAIRKASSKSQGCVLASDAFFPFPDSIALAEKAGIRAIIQPGGSVKDQEVIQAADRAGMAMILTGMRHFRH